MEQKQKMKVPTFSEETLEVYGVTQETMQTAFEAAFDIFSGSTTKADVINKLVEKYGMSKEAAIVGISLGHLMPR